MAKGKSFVQFIACKMGLHCLDQQGTYGDYSYSLNALAMESRGYIFKYYHKEEVVGIFLAIENSKRCLKN